jgi:hypothetical protein
VNTTPTQQPEALRLAESLYELDAQFSLPGLCGDSAAELLSQHAEIARLTAENEALRAQLNAKFIGLQISVDVSAGDNDAGHRLFGTVTGTLDTDPLTLLCDDAKPNFQHRPPITEVRREQLRDAFSEALTDSAYVCTRVWSAWGYGTMSEDDFTPANECEELLDSLIDAVNGIEAKP